MRFGARGAFFDLLADPGRFAELGRHPGRRYPLGPGRYLMLGDNSPWSRDGRAWGRADQTTATIPDAGWDDSGRESWEVPESLIIGKAFCVYWPHLKPVWPMFRLGSGLPPSRPALFRADALDPLVRARSPATPTSRPESRRGLVLTRRKIVIDFLLRISSRRSRGCASAAVW